MASPPVLTFPEFGKPFVGGTDASAVAAGAVLSQKEEGEKVHSIQFASCTLTISQSLYCACSREAIEVVF